MNTVEDLTGEMTSAHPSWLQVVQNSLESIQHGLASLAQAHAKDAENVLQTKVDSIIHQLGCLKSAQEHHHVELLKLLDGRSPRGVQERQLAVYHPCCVDDDDHRVHPSASHYSLDSHKTRFSLLSRTSTVGAVLSHPVQIQRQLSNISLGSREPSKQKGPLIEGITSEDFQNYSQSVPMGIAENTEDDTSPSPSVSDRSHKPLDPTNRFGSGVGKGWFESILGVTPGTHDKVMKISKEEVETAVKVSLGDDTDFVRFMALASRSSLTGTSMALQAETTPLIIQPTWKFRLWWDVVTFIVVIITGLCIPIGFAYWGWREVSEDKMGVLMLLGDFIWLVDVVINLSTAYTEGGKLVTSRWLILAKYARSSLFLDVLTIWPIQLACGNAFMAHTFLLLKMCRTCRVPQLFSRLQTLTDITLFPTMILTIVGLICNSLSCVWQVIQFGVPEDRTSSQVLEEYVRDVYWVIMTMSTVGYGDITPNNTEERLYAIFVMFIAPLVFGAIVSLLSYNVQQRYNDKVAIQVARATRFMSQRCVPQEIQRRVQYNLRTNIHQEHHFALASEILPKLSSVVQRELLCELMRSTVLQFPLFCGANSSFLGDITQAHSWVECAPGDLVMQEGQLLQEIVFIIKGRLHMQYSNSSLHKNSGGRWGSYGSQLSSSRDSGKDFEVETGAWFGEACLFDDRVVRECNIVALVESELAVLRTTDYFKVLKKYPRVMSRHERIKADLKAARLSYSALKYEDTGKAPIKEQRPSRSTFFMAKILPRGGAKANSAQTVTC